MKTPHDLDFWTVGFLGVAIAALAITSVGTFEFFAYILPPALALSATVVLATGIPLLKFAATFDTKRGGGYLGTMGAFLVVELIAQYFKAQAGFAPTVTATVALAGSDLATAASNGVASRVLAFVFLASLPFVVVVMSHAAAERLARRRAVFARLRGAFAGLRADLARAHADVAPLRADLADARATIARYEDWLRQARAELARERSRPVLTAESAVALLVSLGAPDSTIRTWIENGRLRLAEPVEVNDGR